MKNRTLQTVHRKDTIPKLLQMFKKHKVNNFPVVDNKGKLIGDVDLRNILPFAINPDHMSEHDIIGAVGTQIHEIFGDAVEDIMNLHQEMIKPDELIEDAAFIMWKFNIHCIPVVKDNKGPTCAFTEYTFNDDRPLTQKPIYQSTKPLGNISNPLYTFA